MSQDVPVKLLFQKWRISRAVEVVSFFGDSATTSVKRYKIGGGAVIAELEVPLVVIERKLFGFWDHAIRLRFCQPSSSIRGT